MRIEDERGRSDTYLIRIAALTRGANETGGDMARDNEQVVRRGFEAFAAGDMDTMRALLAPDVRWHVPGRSPLSGTHKGPEEVITLFTRYGELSDGSIRIDLHDVVGGDKHVFAAYVVSAERAGRKYRDGSVLMFHVADGRVTEAWQMVGDQYASDNFWS